MMRKIVMTVGTPMLVGVILILGAPAAQAQYGPGGGGAALSDATVAQGDSVTVYATDCPPGLPVSFSLDGATVASAAAAADGVARATFVVEAPAGRHSVTNSCNNVTLTLVVAAGDATAAGPPLSRTGSSTTLLLGRVAAVALMSGGLLLLVSRRRAARS